MSRCRTFRTWLLIAGSLIGRPVHAEESMPEKLAQTAHSPSRIAAGDIRPHVEYLASPELEGRGTARGKDLSRQYLIRQFEELHLEPLFGKGSFEQDIPGPRAKNVERPVLGKNIGAWLEGSDMAVRDEFIVLSAHYDHLGVENGQVYPGADDNAGSVAMMLEVARHFARAENRPRRSLIFLSCDLEEKMLWGARWFVAHPPRPLEKIKLFITAEMIGRTLGDLPMKTIFVLGSGTRSDYGPFQSEKVPFLFFSGGEHADYHTPRDTAERVDCQRAAHVANLIAEVCRRVADAEATPLWTDKPARELDEVRTLRRITDLVLQSDDAARDEGKPRLSPLQRFTVTNVHSRATQIIERGEMKPEERPWLIRSAQLLLLTVF